MRYNHGVALLLAGTMLASAQPALAQDNDTSVNDPDEIVVTASKRAENLQDVPMSVQAIGDAKLDELQVTQFSEFAKFLPSVSIQSAGPGASNVYFRGVASGGDGNHSGSLPSVGMYLDEQPITTIQGALDIHIYDIARVEALAGPQGTLYGASSQAGTIKIITNKPDQRDTYGGADFEVNKVNKGGWGYVAESFLNIAMSDQIAMRVVGYYDHDAGYIDNIAGSLTFPSSEITMNNAPYVKKNYNEVDTYGGRFALGVELDENWTITPSVAAQRQISHGSFGMEKGLGDLQTMQFNPERWDDRWSQAALTIEGKIGSWDVTYAGSSLRRKIKGQSDYADYAYFYDALAGYGEYFYDNAGELVNPNQYINSLDKFKKQSHELRFTSPQDKRLRLIGGLFYQKQKHNIRQDYIIDNIADDITVPGTASDIWLTQQIRTDRDYAAFGEVTFDITPQISVTGGGRYYKYKNSLIGFFGYAEGYSPDKYDDEGNFVRDGTGVSGCNGRAAVVDGSPCTNVDKTTKDSGFIHKLNLTYRPNDDLLFYTTWSRGFRPGGINRRGTLDPYKPDYLTNYEIGWKTTPMPGVRFNGAIYQEEWKDVQLSFLGANGLTEIRSGGDARIRGVEVDAGYRTGGFSLNVGASYNDAKLRKNYCNDTSAPCTGDNLLAPKGTRLPITAKFKGNAVARYDFPIADNKGHFQVSAAYEGKRRSDLRTIENAIQGNLPAYTTVDTSAGITNDSWSVELYVRNLFDKRGFLSNSIQCPETVCGDPLGQTDIGGKIYNSVVQPRTIGLKVGTKF